MVLVDNLLKIKKEFKNLKKQDIQAIFTKMNLIRLVFNMTWHMELLKIWKEEQLLIEVWEIKHLILLKILNIMDIKEDWLASMVYKFFDKKSTRSGIVNNNNDDDNNNNNNNNNNNDIKQNRRPLDLSALQLA